MNHGIRAFTRNFSTSSSRRFLVKQPWVRDVSAVKKWLSADAKKPGAVKQPHNAYPSIPLSVQRGMRVAGTFGWFAACAFLPIGAVLFQQKKAGGV
eukprot:TRINITY_DN1237_c0_g1_i1.p1 TRINITY_DN1237_c0_g1~~TRINITY_DN1237_c0_g1_i1.p1  ORF type:complete len:104 (+),score=23.45 TRINITY_DN1237_c0_g1_i1:25-312(+)